ncbi:MAG TPA: DUF3054 domain-containing protein [Microlunatus sp.]|nr:DUF3054 domain-containing protein [Microlunatus sp.]
MKFWPSLIVDTIAVSVFAIIGRRSHGELSDLAGTWHTAWPFLAGMVLGTVLARSWRRPGSLSSGIVIWACTLVGGMLLRVVSGNTVAITFVIVAGVVLAAFLLGWRGLYSLIRRARARSGVAT